MAIRRRTLILGFLGLIVAGGAVLLWMFWPILMFFRGEAVLYRMADLQADPRGPRPVAIVGGTLIDGHGGAPLDNSVVVIRGDRIVEAGSATSVRIPADAVEIQAAGKTVLPGLADMHVHLNKGDDLHLFIAAGVTTVRDVGNFTDQVAGLASRTTSGEIVGPRIFYSGDSFISEQGFAPWQRPTGSVDEARAEVKKRIAAGATVIKIVSDITPDLTRAIVEEAHRAGVPVTADVLGNTLVTAERAIQLGVDGLEHVSGVPQSIHADGAPTQSQSPVSMNAMLGWMYTDERKEAALIKLMVERGTCMVPTLAVMPMMFPEHVPVPSDPAEAYLSQRLLGLWRGIERIPSLSSSMDRIFENSFLVHFVYSQPFIKRLDAAGGRIVAGTDEPTPGLVPGFSLHRELELLVQAGLTPMRAIQAATKSAAQCLKRDRELGTIEAGKLADLIIVDGAPHVRISDIRQVRTVIKNGVSISTADVLKLPEQGRTR